MADGSITFNTTLDNKELERELSGLKKKIQKTKDQIYAKSQQKLPLLQQSDELSAKLDEAKAKLYEMQNAPKEKSDSLGMKEQSEYTRNLQGEYDKVNNQIDAISRSIQNSNIELSIFEEKAGSIEQKLSAASSAANNLGSSAQGPVSEGIEAATNNAATLGDNIDQSTEGAEELGGAVSTVSPAMSAMNKKMDQFTSRIKGLVKRVFIFSLITSALRKMRTWIGNVIKADSEASAAMAKLKGALLTMAQPIINFVIPAFTLLCNILTRIITLASKLLFSIFGWSYSEAQQSAKALNKEQEAIEGVGGAAKEASKYLSGLDEVNTFSEDQSGGGGGSSASTAAPDFTGMVGDGINSILELVSGVALLAVGAILAFSGASVLLGIGMMVLGAGMIYDAAANDPNLAASLVNSGLNVVLEVIGGLLAVIGIILIVAGHFLLGLGLVIAGIAIFSVGEAAGDEGNFVENIKSRLMEAAEIVGPFVAVLGLILIIVGKILLGLGLLVAGIALFTVATISDDNGATITEKIKTVITTLGEIVGGASLVMGAILVLSGVKIPLGIGLIAVGAVGLVAAVAANWDSIVTALRGPIGTITAIASAALLVLGIILTCVGVIPLGIALIAAGAVSLVTVTAINWNAITEKIRDIWQSVKNFWNKYIAPVFTAQWWLNLAKKCGNGLIDGFEGAVNGIISMFEKMINWIVGGLNKISFDVPDWVPLIGGKKFGFNIPEVSFGRVSIPRLAQGAVIPPNREFMAVLGDQKHGTNIEAPLDTIKQAVAEVLRQQGTGSPQSGSYRFTAQINRRTLFDEMITEAKLRQTQTGRNPFEFA